MPSLSIGRPSTPATSAASASDVRLLRGQAAAGKFPPLGTTVAASTYASPPTVAHSNVAPIGLTSVNYDDGRLSYRGMLPGTVTVSANVCRMNAANGYTGTLPAFSAAAAYGSFRMAFDFYGDEFVMMTMPLKAANYFWLWVDGQPATAAPSLMDHISIGTGTWTTFTFGSEAMRRIEIVMPGFIALKRFYIGATDSLGPVEGYRPKVAFLGDSWMEGTGTNEGLEIPARIGLLTGWDVYRCGQGGTGYVNPGPGSQSKGVFGDTSRTTAIGDIDPDYVVIFGGGNDDAYSPFAVEAAAIDLYEALGDACPAAKLVVVGPQCVGTGIGNIPAARTANADAISTAADAASNVLGFMDPLADDDGSPWITGTGTTSSPTGSGNADIYASGTSAFHPSTAGHDYVARRVLAGMIPLMTA